MRKYDRLEAEGGGEIGETAARAFLPCLVDLDAGVHPPAGRISETFMGASNLQHLSTRIIGNTTSAYCGQRMVIPRCAWRNCFGYNRGVKILSPVDGAEAHLSYISSIVWAGVDGVRTARLQNLVQRCASRKAILEGKSCHGLAIQGQLQTDTLTCNILINMYCKCGLICEASKVFDRMPVRTIVSWNTMIGGLIHHGECDEALAVFMRLHREGTSLSEYTLSSVLCVCASKAAVFQSKQLHTLALKIGMFSNVYVGTALLDVYAKCNIIQDARWIFNKMPEKSCVTWSSMIAGFVYNGQHEEALLLFKVAQNLGLERTQFTFSAALSASAGLAAAIEGVQLHALLVRAGLDLDTFVATSLLDAYSRCGRIKEAYAVFTDVGERNIVVWNAMIAGFSRHAHAIEALILFVKMNQSGINPNEVTYISVLSAMGHVGSVEKGQQLFYQLSNDKNVKANVLHYSCMVDVLGRAGRVHEAWELIERMPFKVTASMWGSLLGSCRIHGNLNLAEIAAGHLFEMEPSNAANHILLSNLYAAKKRWQGVAMRRKLLKDSGAKKERGMSWIGIKNKVHTFVVGEGNHPRIIEIWAKLDELENEMKKLAYKAQTEYDLHDVGNEQKEELLRHHSEKLALALGLISLPCGVEIRIYKNIRICGDCHSVMKLASSITNREIILRDTNRFHHFQHGSCSCQDFW